MEEAMTAREEKIREEKMILARSLEHLHGPEEIPYGEDELVVVCLVRDGRPYVKSFVEHYFALGAKYIAFLDNNSTDGTVEALREYNNVTVLRTKLPYKANTGVTRDGITGNGWTPEILFKQYLISRFGKQDRWCLCVDIDELFDYPYSDVVSLRSLLSYLSSKSYTAVAAQMLDMFPQEPLSGRAGNLDVPLKKLHRFYDISNLKRRNIKNNVNLRDNTYGSDEIDRLFGGIRNTIFGTSPCLTKFPLVFLDGRTKPMDDSSHRVGCARVADITGVLFHYKFLDAHFHKQVVQAVREEHHFGNSAEYKKYLEVLDKTPSLQIKRETARELKGVNELLENQLLVVSDDYVSWADAEERSVLRAASWSGEPSGLAEAFLESRRRERAKILRIQRLERQLRQEAQRLSRKETQRLFRQEAQRLSGENQRLSGENQRLSGENQRLSGENQRLSHKEDRRLMRHVRNLERELESVRASRTWKLMERLHRIKVKALNPGRSSS
jgi:Glycosyl transferase family 2